MLEVKSPPNASKKKDSNFRPQLPKLGFLAKLFSEYLFIHICIYTIKLHRAFLFNIYINILIPIPYIETLDLLV